MNEQRGKLLTFDHLDDVAVGVDAPNVLWVGRVCASTKDQRCGRTYVQDPSSVKKTHLYTEGEQLTYDKQDFMWKIQTSVPQ